MILLRGQGYSEDQRESVLLAPAERSKGMPESGVTDKNDLIAAIPENGREAGQQGSKGAAGTTLRRIRDLDELVELVRASEPTLYVRYSKGPEHDMTHGPSRDYEAEVDLPGLSVTNISPEPWWSRPIDDWVARRICKYLELGQEEDRYPWLLTGTETGRGPDHEPLVQLDEVVGRLDDTVVDEARRLYEARFDVGDDSTESSESDGSGSVENQRGGSHE